MATGRTGALIRGISIIRLGKLTSAVDSHECLNLADNVRRCAVLRLRNQSNQLRSSDTSLGPATWQPPSLTHCGKLPRAMVAVVDAICGEAAPLPVFPAVPRTNTVTCGAGGSPDREPRPAPSLRTPSPPCHTIGGTTFIPKPLGWRIQLGTSIFSTTLDQKPLFIVICHYGYMMPQYCENNSSSRAMNACTGSLAQLSDNSQLYSSVLPPV